MHFLDIGKNHALTLCIDPFASQVVQTQNDVLRGHNNRFTVGWAEDVEYAQEEGVPVDYVFPEEGAILWGDNFIVPTTSSNPYTAELFLDFLLRPDINAQIVNETYYATANEAAQSLIDPEIRDNPIIFPPAEALKNAEVILPLSSDATGLYTDLWAQFEAQVNQ